MSIWAQLFKMGHRQDRVEENHTKSVDVRAAHFLVNAYVLVLARSGIMTLTHSRLVRAVDDPSSRKINE